MYEDQPLVAVRVLDGIFIGNATAAADEDFLIMNKVTHIVNCAGAETKDYFKHIGISYLNFPWSLPSGGGAASTLFDANDKNVESIVRFVDETRAQGECVLIHSVHGRSRSCAIVAAFFVIKYRWTLEHALDFIAMAHEDMDIAPPFRKQLDVFYQRHEVPPSQTGRALDIFHPDVDDGAFALDNEQWMLRNTYINGLVTESQEKTDLFKVATGRVQLAEPNPKSAAKRRRRITFCDTKQGTAVACMWTQPVVPHRNQQPPATIVPPREPTPSIVARPGTPLLHRLEGEAIANVHTATNLTATPGSGEGGNFGHGSRGCGTFKLQLRSSIQQMVRQQQHQQQGVSVVAGGGNNTIASQLNLARDSPVIGSGPALVATGSLAGMQRTQLSAPQQDPYNNGNSNNEMSSGGYNQSVHRVLPQQQQQQQQSYNEDYRGTQPTATQQQQQQQPSAYNNNVTVTRVSGTLVGGNNNGGSGNSGAGGQLNNGRYTTAQPPPSAANIAASLGTTGQGSLITLRGGGAPLSANLSVGSGLTTGNNNSNSGSGVGTAPTMRPIPDANATVSRPLNMMNTSGSGGAMTGGGNAPGAHSMTAPSGGGGNSTTPIRPGPVVRGGSQQSAMPGHNRNNPFTLPAAGRTTHRGSPLPMSRVSGGAAPGVGGAMGGGSRLQMGQPSQRTNSPIRNASSATAAAPTSSAFGAYGGSPIRSSAGYVGGGAPAGGISPRVNPNSSGMMMPAAGSNNAGTSMIRGGSPMQPQRGSSPMAQRNGLSSGSGGALAPTSYSSMYGSAGAGSSPASLAPRGNSPSAISRQPFNAGPGARPPSPSRGPAPGAPPTTLWSSSLMGQQQQQQPGGGALAATAASGGASSSLLRPRAGSPLVRSNSPTSYGSSSVGGGAGAPPPSGGGSLLGGGYRQSNLPSAGAGGISSLAPPSRPASLSAQLSAYPSSHIPRNNSPVAAGRTNSPIRNSIGSSGGSGGASFLQQQQPLRGNSPMTRSLPAGNASNGGGSLAEQFLMRGAGTTAAGRNSPMLRR